MLWSLKPGIIRVRVPWPQQTLLIMIIYKPLKLKFSNRLEAKRYFGQTKFNKLLKNKDNFEFINDNVANYYENLSNNTGS